MPASRRLVIAALSLAPWAVRAQPTDPRLAVRSAGAAEAPVTVQEFYSLTCPHCAAFQKETFPQVKAKLIDTGRIRYVWRDFPLDQLALTAAMVARALPPERYEAFISALLASQDRWAFARGINPTEELAKLAALAGLSRATFNSTVVDEELKKAVLTDQDAGEKQYQVRSTPSFVMNGKLTAGAIQYADFEKAVEAAAA